MDTKQKIDEILSETGKAVLGKQGSPIPHFDCHPGRGPYPDR